MEENISSSVNISHNEVAARSVHLATSNKSNNNSSTCNKSYLYGAYRAKLVLKVCYREADVTRAESPFTFFVMQSNSV